MLKRYVGHQSPVSVVIGGEDFGYVETGDSIVVPDDLANAMSWPEENWEDGAPPKSKSRAKTKVPADDTNDDKNDEKSGE